MFAEDIKNNSEQITGKVKDKSVLVIGGAGSIGSSFRVEFYSHSLQVQYNMNYF